MKSFQFKRTQRVKICERFADWSVISRGVPQGPVQFSLLLIMLLTIYTFQSQIGPFADDNQLFFSREYPSTIRAAINDDFTVEIYSQYARKNLDFLGSRGIGR